MKRKNEIFSFLLGIALAAFVIIISFPIVYANFPSERSLPQYQTFPSPIPETSTKVTEEKVRNLEWGNITFNTPKKINLEEPKIIELLLSPSKSVQELQSSLKSHEQTESARIQISNRMEADLSGLGFKIEALAPQEQAVYDRGKTTQWRWEVIPTKDGNQNLYLTLSAIINVSSQKVPIVIRTFDKTIKVEVSVGQRISTFVAGNWQWLWASILIPLFPFLWKWYQRKQGKKQSLNKPGAVD